MRFSCPEIWKGRARESGEKEERRSRRRKLQKLELEELEDGEDPVVQQVEPQQAGGWRSGNQGKPGMQLLCKVKKRSSQAR